jgi:prepilin signal peptidase PulO-like enzyme (type II secretory pathway)
MLVAFASGSVGGLALIARRGWAARRRTIPFAPCLAIGALVAMVLQR